MERIPSELRNIPLRELADICRLQLGRWPHPGATRAQMVQLLRYKVGADEEQINPIDVLRDELLAFIAEHENELALPCHQNCYLHADALVVACQLQLRRDTDMETKLSVIEF